MAKKANTSIQFITCENDGCDNTFKLRGPKAFCSNKCRLQAHRKEVAQGWDDLGICHVEPDTTFAYQLSAFLAAEYYSTRPQDREAFVRNVLENSLTDDSGLVYRRALTCPNLAEAGMDKEDEGLYYNHCPQNYRTIAQIADKYCLEMFGIRIYEYVKKPRNFADIPVGIGMRKFDDPFFYNASEYKVPSVQKIVTEMRGRPSHIVEYTMKLFRVWPEQVEQLAA